MLIAMFTITNKKPLARIATKKHFFYFFNNIQIEFGMVKFIFIPVVVLREDISDRESDFHDKQREIRK